MIESNNKFETEVNEDKGQWVVQYRIQVLLSILFGISAAVSVL